MSPQLDHEHEDGGRALNAAVQQYTRAILHHRGLHEQANAPMHYPAWVYGIDALTILRHARRAETFSDL